MKTPDEIKEVNSSIYHSWRNISDCPHWHECDDSYYSHCQCDLWNKAFSLGVESERLSNARCNAPSHVEEGKKQVSKNSDTSNTYDKACEDIICLHCNFMVHGISDKCEFCDKIRKLQDGSKNG